MHYNFPKKAELLAEPNKVFTMKRIELQSWGTWFRSNGYEMCKLNAPSAIIANAVYDAFVLMAQLKAETKALENVQNQPSKPVAEAVTALVKPVKRDYLITFGSERGEGYTAPRSMQGKSLQRGIEFLLRRTQAEHPFVILHWSKARLVSI